MKLEQIVQGTLIWWRAERMFKEWDCPGIIDKITPETGRFIIVTFDNFKMSSHALDEKNEILSELRIATKKEIARYLEEREYFLKGQILTAKRAWEDSEDTCAEWLTNKNNIVNHEVFI